MKTNYLTCALTLISLAITPFALADKSKTVKIERTNGALHSEFIELIQAQVAELKSGSGRIALKGGAGFRICTADLYVSEETTFVSLSVGSIDFIDEFYIDHPAESFKSILFQNRTSSSKKTVIQVDRRDGGFMIRREGDNLFISTRKKEKSSPECKFALNTASYYDGESE